MTKPQSTFPTSHTKFTLFLYAALPHKSKDRGVFYRLVASILEVATNHKTPILYIATPDIHKAIGQALGKIAGLNPTLLTGLYFSHETPLQPHPKTHAVYIKDLKKQPRDFESDISYDLVAEQCSRAVFIGGYPHNRAGGMNIYSSRIFATHPKAQLFLVTSLGGNVVQLQDGNEHRKQIQVFSSNDYPRFQLLLERYIFTI